MDTSRLFLAITYTTVSIILTCSGLHGQFVPAGSIIKSISQRSTIKVSQYCGDEIQCRSLLNQTQCLKLNVCQQVQTCNGRNGFPSSEDPLLKWTLNTAGVGCGVTEEKPADVPSTLSIPENARLLSVDGTGSDLDVCYVRKDSSNVLGDVFSLTFWIKADCANCTIVDLSKRGDSSSLLIKVVDSDHVCIGQTCTPNNHLNNGQWAFIAVTSYKGVIKLYIDGDMASELNHPVDDAFIGTTAASNDSVFHIFHAQFFPDVLTPREVKEMKTGLGDPIIGNCRCLPDFPDVSSADDSMCVNSRGETYPRYNSSVEFKPPDVILEQTPENWASSELGPVTLLLNLSLSFQIESIEIDFMESPPTRITYRLSSNGREKDLQDFTCTAMKCRVQLGPLDSSTAMDEFEDTTADNVKIVLNRDNNDVRSFILSKITVTGRCDCHGNAASCTSNGNTYSCSCDANTNTRGPHCRSCNANFFRQVGDFDCKHPCLCSQDGVADKNDQCDENGGACICKEHVEGNFCDRCEPWTYNLDGLDSKGCTACPCRQSGSESCNNVTGVCTCKRNVQTPHCHECLVNHYGFSLPQGCAPCDCAAAGTEGQALTCNDGDGQCTCKAHVEGRNCDLCKAGFFKLQTANLLGCEKCDCNPVGIDNSSCHMATGQCTCRGGVITDRTCSPEIMSIEPTYGPLVGATRITIRGKLLGNFTRSVSVYVGNVEQPIVAVNDSAIIVETKQHNSVATSDLKVGWVGIANTLKAPASYSYLKDPVLDASRTIKGSSFLSGGCTVQLFGRNLESVNHPRLDVWRKDDPSRIVSGPCYHVRGRVVCRTPNASSVYTLSSDQFEMSAVFDGISLQLGDIDIKPDPIIRNVGNIEFQHPFEDSISFSGKNLLSACETNTYSIHIGAIKCTITHTSNTDIECEPPTQKPKGPNKVPITLTIGSIQRVVGTLEYLELYETTGFIIIICCIAALIAIIIGVFVARYFYRHRRQQPKSNNNAGISTISKAADRNAHVINRPMNTYSELNSVTNSNARSNGHNGVIRVESVFLEPKKGIVNTAAETSVFEDEFLPHVEPGLKADVTSSFIGGGSFVIGSACLLVGQKASLVDGTLRRQRHTGQRLIIKSFAASIQETLQAPGDENSLLVSWVQQTLKECLRFRKHKHNHLMHTIGIGVEHQRIHILYEYMSKGTLKTVVADTEQDYSVRKLLGFSQQVAEGIAFLASKDITHKDIASRNCMVDEYSMVKLGDASFGWDFYPDEYVYNEQRERHLPLRWMAPESIDHGYYDMRTDVWSFGVLVWELLTRGCLPFHEVGDSDVTDYILNGYILGKPETISEDLYTLLRSCWSPENEGRPSINAISSALCNVLETDDDDGTYANLASPRMRASTEAHFYSSTNISGV